MPGPREHIDWLQGWTAAKKKSRPVMSLGRRESRRGRRKTQRHPSVVVGLPRGVGTLFERRGAKRGEDGGFISEKSMAHRSSTGNSWKEGASGKINHRAGRKPGARVRGEYSLPPRVQRQTPGKGEERASADGREPLRTGRAIRTTFGNVGLGEKRDACRRSRQTKYSGGVYRRAWAGHQRTSTSRSSPRQG